LNVEVSKWWKMDKGFTLIELMIVILVIAILVAIAIPVYARIQDKAHKRSCQANLRILKSALETYRATNGVYPDPDSNPHWGGSKSGHTIWHSIVDPDDDQSDLVPYYIRQSPICPNQKGIYLYRYNENPVRITCDQSGHEIY